MQNRVFQLLVDNNSGVLSRISGLFSRRGYNIESITAGVTADSRFSRITIVTSGEEEILDQIEKQVAKLIDVRDIRELKPEKSVYRELCLIKVRSTPEKRQGVISVADIFRAKIVDVNTHVHKSDADIAATQDLPNPLCLVQVPQYQFLQSQESHNPEEDR